MCSRAAPRSHAQCTRSAGSSKRGPASARWFCERARSIGDDAPSFADVSSPVPLKTPGSRRCSVSPTAMAVPVLMSKLRGKLGQGAKLPRKKDQLVALYNEHFAE